MYILPTTVHELPFNQELNEKKHSNKKDVWCRRTFAESRSRDKSDGTLQKSPQKQRLIQISLFVQYFDIF